MGNITFHDIMGFYPKHNRSVYEDLKKDFQHGRLIPFVGAGLSAFCGYKLWPDVLKELAGYIYDCNIRSNVETMIDKGKLLQAAQVIQTEYPPMLKVLRKIIDYDKIKNCDNDKMYASAAYVLPYLFNNGLVMTTNFDRVLEEVYDRRHTKFGKVITPYEPDLLTQIRQSNSHCLFKLHGDIGPDIHDIERLVFTQTQYDKAYASDGPLMQELPQWFQNKKLLFLGCSLENDRTMEVPQQVTRKNPGLDHYAILACHPDDIQQRCIEMGKLGISAIYYPDKKHEAVRIILERLLEETNYAMYEELNLHARKPIPTSESARRFMYDSDYIHFVGRENELAQLQEFCKDPEQVSWWAVVGPGGMGKSRLIYEFTKSQRNDGWKVCWLGHNEYDNLVHWMPPTDRCIVIADDVQAHLQTLGNWILSISARPRSEKLRIILLERDGTSLDSAKWTEFLQSEDPYDDTISSKCYCQDFLKLSSLSDDELKVIMTEFAKTSGKPLEDSGHSERLLQTLKKIDGTLQRPIYALAITDAWCRGDNPNRWNKEQILDYLVNRELKFYYERLRNLSTSRISREMRSELENLLARSCLTYFLPLNEIADNECPKLRKRADELDMDFPELLQQIGIVHKIELIVQSKDSEPENQTEQKKTIEAVILNCPDLVKESLVLRQSLDKHRLNLLFPENWDNDPMPLFFFRQLLLDYPEKLEGNDQFCNAFFAGNPTSELSAWMYSGLLVGATVQLHGKGKQVLERLSQLHEKYQTSQEIAGAYAIALFSMTIKQPLKECEKSVDKLAELYQNFPTNEEIADAYAKGLVNLSAEQPLQILEKSVAKLAELHKNFPTNEQIAGEYASGLVNLSFAQTKEDDIKESIKLAKKLFMQFRQNTKIQLAYAQTQFNLTLKQESQALRKSVAQLRDFLLAHPDANREFQTALDVYLSEHPNHTERYINLRL